MTNLQFLLCGKENLIPESGKEMYSTTPKKAFQIHKLLPCSHARILSALPAQHLAFQGEQWQHSKIVLSVPFHAAEQNLLTREKTASSVHKTWIGDSLIGIPTRLTRQAHYTNLTDPVSQHTVLNQKDLTANRRTRSISNLIVLNIASSLQINGNIKSRTTGIPSSLWSS